MSFAVTALAREIRAESGINCITATIDLAAPDAFERILAVEASSAKVFGNT